MKTLLIIADSPTLETGFGRVCKNLLNAWLEAGVFDQIEIWGIGYTGWPHSMPVKIYPAQCYESANWNSLVNMTRLARLIEGRRYTHLWVMQDLFLLSSPASIETLGKAIQKGDSWGMESTCYFPVDAPIDHWWCNFLSVVNRRVAYTRYGSEEVLNCISRLDSLCLENPLYFEPEIIPHGTDTSIYYPTGEDKTAIRKRLLAGYDWSEDDFLIINVNQNQRRKGLVQTLQTFQRLMAQDHERSFKLYMHMRSVNEREGVDLKVVARALGIEKHVMFGDAAFVGGKALLPEEGLNLLYNAADLLLTTTMGEGWGLSVTEAMAAGCPVAGPLHTSFEDILYDEVKDDERGIIFGAVGFVILTDDNNRLRPISDPDDAARVILNAIGNDSKLSGFTCLMSYRDRALEWVRRPEFRWKAIAEKFYSRES